MAYTTQASGIVPGGSANPTVSFSQIASAMGAPATNIKLGDYYRNGSYVKGDGNNQYVPTSGNVLPVSRLRGACRRVICTVTSAQNRIDLSGVYSHSNEVWNGSSWVTGPFNEWGRSTDKTVQLNANVYSNNTTEAFRVPTGAGSQVVLNMNGSSIYGYGGNPGGSNAGQGGQGYTAIYTQSNLAINGGGGSIVGGGGGGGGGGRGGQEGNDGRNNRNYCCGWFCPQCSSCDRGVGGGNDGGGSGGQGGRGAWYTTGAQGGQGGQNPGNGGGGGGSGGPGGGLGSNGSNGQGGGPGSPGPGGNCQGGGGGQGGQGGGSGGGSGHWVVGNQYISTTNVTTSGRSANS